VLKVSSFANVTFYPLWLLLMVALVIAMPVAGGIALTGGLLILLGRWGKR
jgi:hypothetical protein